MTETYWLIAISLIVVVLAADVFRLRRANQALTKKIADLADIQGAMQKDLQLMCAAAVAVDQQLADNGARITSAMENVNRPTPAVTPKRAPNQVSSTLQVNKKPDSPQSQAGYDLAIAQIRQGADIESLVRDHGLSKDEAVLLMRLHGQR